jgi:hypothetical protein
MDEGTTSIISELLAQAPTVAVLFWIVIRYEKKLESIAEELKELSQSHLKLVILLELALRDKAKSEDD